MLFMHSRLLCWKLIRILQCSDGPGIVTDYGLDGPGSNLGGDEIFRPSRPALGSTQPSVKWVSGLSPEVTCGWGVLLTNHPLLVPRSWKSRAIPLPTLWTTLGLLRDHFTFTLYIYICIYIYITYHHEHRIYTYIYIYIYIVYMMLIVISNRICLQCLLFRVDPVAQSI